MSEKPQNYTQKTPEESLRLLESDPKEGLSSSEAQSRLARDGKNILQSDEDISPLKLLASHLNSLIVYLLLAASLISFFMGDIIEGVAILIAVFISVFFGFVTEYQAQKSIASLQELLDHEAKVLRDGSIQTIPAEDLVPGDILFLEEGDAIACDGRLIQSSNLACIEAALTGESEPVEKNADLVLEDEKALGDQANMVFSGTSVSRGNGYALVTATGMETEIGRISSLMQDQEETPSPLKEELDRLSKLLIAFAATAAVIVIILGFFTGRDLPFIVQIAIIMAIASIPEAMPAVSTMTMARGMRIMADHQALVKTMPAVETLGSTKVICSDKTGTLTENQMTVENIYLRDGRHFLVTGSGYEPEGEILLEDEDINPKTDDPLSHFIEASVLASNASLDLSGDLAQIIGDPTEGALVVLGEKAGFRKNELTQASWKKEEEIPFQSENKYMAVAYRKEDEGYLFVKGAPDVLLDLSQDSQDIKAAFEEANQRFAQEGKRVLAVAGLQGLQEDIDEEGMTHSLDQIELLGLVGIMDPPRQDVADSVASCQDAGIEVKMITGDHPQTASVIAEKIGIEASDEVLTGAELDDLFAHASPKKTDRTIRQTGVFARVSPENKLQIVESLRRQDAIVAMTGDGVNDAPAVNGADIGIAMGIRGTQVAKDAADMILTDDRFATIVDAVREGRIIFDNIKKYVYYLFTCNMVELVAIFSSLLFLLPMPILPVQILWLNLVVDIFPALALSYEPAEEDVMERPPRKKGQGLVNKLFIARTLLSGTVLGLAAFFSFNFALFQNMDLATAQTMTFATMALAQVAHTFNVRREKGFGLDKTLFDNKPLLGALLISVLTMLFAIYTPFMNEIMSTVPLPLSHWGIIVIAAIVATVLVYILKRIFSLHPDE